MSYLGNTKIGKMHLGNTEIAKAYLGEDLVFQKGGGPILPTGYTQLEYIENPLGNSAYFMSGLGGNGPTDYKIDWMSFDDTNDSTYGCILGGRYGSNSDDFQLSTYTMQSGWSGTVRLGAAGQNFNAHLPAKNTRFTAELSGNKYTIGGVQYTVSRGTLAGHKIAVFALCQRNTTIQQNGHGRLYSLKFYTNGVLSRNYIPCLDSNNVPGVYDTVNENFTPSANSTPFVAGPTIL